MLENLQVVPRRMIEPNCDPLRGDEMNMSCRPESPENKNRCWRMRFTGLVWMSIASVLVLGCASNSHGDPLIEKLQASLSATWPESTYMVATVDTPQGLWNVYVVSIPPNQIAIRQSRQDGEYEFGMIDDLIWHIAYGKAQPTRLGDEWAWFLRSHEFFRFSEWLSSLDFHSIEISNPSTSARCTTRIATDRFGLNVTLCLDPSGKPLWIERATPALYGDQTVRIEIDRWDEFEDREMPGKFTQIQGNQQFHWEIQGVFHIPDDQANLQPPASLREDNPPETRHDESGK